MSPPAGDTSPLTPRKKDDHMTNRDHADRLRAQADAATQHRAALLCARACLTTTKTISAAITALNNWDGPDETKTAALAILADLEDQP